VAYNFFILWNKGISLLVAELRGGGTISSVCFHDLVSISNLLLAWKRFSRGKRKNPEVAKFELHLEHYLFGLHKALVEKTYTHDPYVKFVVHDPKRRNIHKASVRDRVLHQSLFQKLYPVFDRHFIYDSYSSRESKGTHVGVERLERACRKETHNWQMPAYALKCDIRKFFDSIDKDILKELLFQKIDDPEVRLMIGKNLNSFQKSIGKGLPLGNVTSQLFANVYMNEFDQYVKHVLKAKHYFRYCDDFVIVSKDRNWLVEIFPQMTHFLKERLLLDIHPQKVQLRKISTGIDFLGYVVRPHVKTVRNSTRRRIVRKVGLARKAVLGGEMSRDTYNAIVESYKGVVSHAREGKLRGFLEKGIF
jgi:retron-type reverse transcriptase